MAFPWALGGAAAANPMFLLGTGLQAGGAIGSLLSRPKKMEVPDIGAELARIRAYYDQAASVARQGITQRAGEARTQAASNLAARGIYSSPVSQNVFGRLEQERQRNLAESDSQIGLGSAQAQAGALGMLMGAQQQAQQYNNQLQAQRQAAIYGGLGQLGTSLMNFGLSGMGQKKQQLPWVQADGEAFQAGPWMGQFGYNRVSPYGDRTELLKKLLGGLD